MSGKISFFDDKIALFDMDGTLFDLHGAMLKELQKMRSPGEPEILDPWDRSPWLEERRKAIKRVPGFWRDLPRFELGWDILEMAKGIGFSIQILTKGPSNTPIAWMEKLECVRRHLGEVSVHISDNTDEPEASKAQHYGRVLVDDYPPYVEAWLNRRPRGLAILPAHDYNADFKHPQAVRYSSIREDVPKVREALQKAFDRKVFERKEGIQEDLPEGQDRT